MKTYKERRKEHLEAEMVRTENSSSFRLYLEDTFRYGLIVLGAGVVGKFVANKYEDWQRRKDNARYANGCAATNNASYVDAEFEEDEFEF
jgi:hypothetical protein